MSNTKENLKEAFIGESMANRKYTAYAEKAEQEGFPQIARLFKAAAAAETVHAHNHLRIMGGIGTTEENLQDAIEGETYEFQEMYPGFLEVASEEEEDRASWSFNIANDVEKIHANLYQKAAEVLKDNKDLPAVEYYVCQVCGNTVEEAPPEKCPICNAPSTSFELIN